MANKIVVDTGKTWLGKYMMTGTGTVLNNNAVMHLFYNGVTIAHNTTLGELAEVTNVLVPGYVPVTLGTAIDGGIDSSFFDTWVWPTVTFEATGTPSPSPLQIIGYFVTDATNTVLLWALNFSPLFTFAYSGDGFTLVPTFSFGSIF